MPLEGTVRQAASANPQRETVLISILLAIFLGFVALDLLTPVGGSADAEAQLANMQSAYRAELSLTKLKYERVGQALVGELRLEVVADKSVASIDHAAFALQQSMVRGEGGKPEPRWTWEQFPSKTGSFQPMEDENGPALEITNPVRLTVQEGRRESYYPFDNYILALTPRGCASAELPCPPGSPIALKKVAISLDQSEFNVVRAAQTGGAGEIRFIVERPFFVRWVSGWLAVFSLVFLVYLLSVRDPRKLLTEALGFFAAIWALRNLVIPDTVKLFPTMIDYYTLSLFGVLFICVSVRVVFTGRRIRSI